MSDVDIHNFSSSSPHRLPTLSASQALQNLTSAPKQFVSTGLKTVDAVLQGREPVSSEDVPAGGLTRGQVTEIYGPPGVGKTTFAMQLAANALQSGDSVVWVDTSYTLPGSRFKEILSSASSPTATDLPTPSAANSTDSLLERFHHYQTPTLPHLLALLIHPSPNFPPPETSLIVTDAISTLFASAFPKSLEPFNPHQATPAKRSDAAQWAASRRWAVMGDFISKIGRLAATRNIAILLASQTTTRVRAETGAVLHPAVASTAWDAGISARIVFWRGWVHDTAEGSPQPEFIPGVRFAGVVKAGGVSYEGAGKVASLSVYKHGLQEINVDQQRITTNRPLTLQTLPLKRKHDEIANSQSEDGDVGSDEEFGWLGDDDPLTTEDLPE